MNRGLIETAVALADALARENMALTALDLPRAAAMLGQKQAAVAAFSAAQTQAAAAMAGALDGEQRRLAEDVATRLQALASENRRLLERALLVQRRVLGSVGRAAAKAAPKPPRYGATGALTPARQAPVVVSARV